MADETKIILDCLGSMAENTKMVLERLDNLDSRMDTMESNMDDMKSQVSGINLILENEIKRNIQIIAEGHLDLSRKLDDAIKVKEEREMLLMRTNVLESDVRMLKDKVNKLSSVS